MIVDRLAEEEHQEASSIDYRRRTLGGGVALVLRQAVVKGAAIVGGVVLARVLGPDAFGTYAIVVFAVTAFSLVGDMGLGAALIQQAAEPTERQLRTVFTLQLAVFGAAAAAIFVAAPLVATVWSLDDQAVWLMRALAVGLVISALRTLPAVRLERHLEFGPLAAVEAAQAIVFQASAVAAAIAGWGVLSFGVAALAGTTTATVILNVVAPWRPGMQWDATEAGRLLRFGLPFQGTGVLSFLRDAVNPIFIGLIAGITAVGYVNWAILVVSYPLLISAILARLYFPAFARLRSQVRTGATFGSALIRWMAFIAVALTVPFLPIAAYWTEAVFGTQWLPAVPLLYLLAVSIPFTAAATVGLGILNAAGRSGTALAYSAAWFGATWAVTVPAVVVAGWIGFGLANAIVTVVVAPLFFRAVERELPIRSLTSLGPSLAAGVTAVVVGRMLASLLETSIASALGVAAAAATIYAVLWLAMCRHRVLEDLRLLRSVLAN